MNWGRNTGLSAPFTLALITVVCFSQVSQAFGCRLAFERVNGANRQIQYALGGSLRYISPEALALFKRLHDGQLTPSSLTLSESNLLKKEGLSDLFTTHANASPLFKALNYYRALWTRSQNATPRRVALSDIANWGRDISRLDLNSRRLLATDLYAKILEEPETIFSKEDKARVEKLGLVSDIGRFRGDRKRGTLQEGIPPNATANDLYWHWARRMGNAVVEPVALPTRTLVSILHFLFPVPMPISNFRLNQYYRKALEIPEAVRTGANAPALIRNRHLEADVTRYMKDAKIFPKEFKKLNQFHQMRNAALMLLAGGVALAASTAPYSFISTDESTDEGQENGSDGKEAWEKDGFLGMSRYDDKTELIFTSPFPEQYVRVGGLVYHYGLNQMERFPLSEFKRRLRNGKGEVENHIRVELNLNAEAKEALIEGIESDLKKQYVTFYPYRDGTLMANERLVQAGGLTVPPVINRSQSGTLAYFNLLKRLGDKRIGAMRFATAKGSERTAFALDAAKNFADAALFSSNSEDILFKSWFWDPLTAPRDYTSQE